MNIRFYVALGLLLVSMIAQTQPVLDFSVEPVLGNTMKYLGANQAQFPDPGNPGPDQEYDLPFLFGGASTLNLRCIAVAGTPFAAQYPAAQYCVKTEITGLPSKFAYYAKTDSSIRFLGQAFQGNVVYKNNPAWEQIYPLQFGEIKNGQFAGTLKSGNQTTYYRTQFQQHYDGYGTLSFDGSGSMYDPVMRVKSLITRVDSLPTTNGAHKRTVVIEESYKWFAPGIPGYVAFVSEVNAVQMTIAANGDTSQFQQFPPQFAAEQQVGFSVSAEEPSSIDAALFQVVENPVHDWLVMESDASTDPIVLVTVMDISGKIIASIQTTSPEALRIPVMDYPAGTYIVIGTSAQGVSSARKWIKQ